MVRMLHRRGRTPWRSGPGSTSPSPADREQGLVRTAFEPADLFAPETLDGVVV
jgi:hypothetical protein